MLSFPPVPFHPSRLLVSKNSVGRVFSVVLLARFGWNVCLSVCLSAVYFAKEVISPSLGWSFLWFHCSFVSSSSFVVFSLMLISKLLHWSAVNCCPSVLSHIPSAITSRPLGTQPPSLVPDLGEWKCKLMKKQIHLELFFSLFVTNPLFIVLPSFSSVSNLTITTTTQGIHHNLSSDWSSSFILFFLLLLLRGHIKPHNRL